MQWFVAAPAGPSRLREVGRRPLRTWFGDDCPVLFSWSVSVCCRFSFIDSVYCSVIGPRLAGSIWLLWTQAWAASGCGPVLGEAVRPRGVGQSCHVEVTEVGGSQVLLEEFPDDSLWGVRERGGTGASPPGTGPWPWADAAGRVL